ncbi:epoxide hydrolase B-like [Carya illinoinensis]|uniref:epoxide hydrolase B-like n=1 Tax=Carya illinoinensis TaxID=32201 RepID=UPI001C7203EF|nr:epoxide hydrolase B-like [Carya illinoinensis]
MEKIQHSHIQVRGLKLHVAEINVTGEKVVVFLHGFPEIWYTWRHQMIATANAGYRAIAIDFRGYGLSEQPPESEKATFKDLVDDVHGLLDSSGIDKKPSTQRWSTETFMTVDLNREKDMVWEESASMRAGLLG